MNSSYGDSSEGRDAGERRDEGDDLPLEADLRRLDAGLCEVVGGEQAPDVVARVLARHAAGEVVDAGEIFVPSASVRGAAQDRPARDLGLSRLGPWIAAALLLLGVSTVLGVAWLQRLAREPATAAEPAAPLRVAAEAHASERSASESQEQDPGSGVGRPASRVPPVRLTSREQIATLPRDLHAVEIDASLAREFDRSMLEQLLRLPGLQQLVCRDCPALDASCIPLLAAARPLHEVVFGEAPWLTLAHAEQLLAAGKRVEVGRIEIERTGAGRFEVARFEIGRTDVRRDDLVFATQLHDLTKQYSRRQIHTVSEIADLTPLVTQVEVRNLGDRAAARLRACRWLEVVEFIRDDEDPLTRRGLADIATLPLLQTLNLAGVANLPPDALTELVGHRSLGELRISSAEVSDAALQGLTTLPNLRSLGLRGVRSFGDAGMQAIAACRGLESLDLSGCTQLTTDALARIGALREMKWLRLATLPELRDRALMPLRNLRSLREVDLSGGPFTSMGLQAFTDTLVLTKVVLADCREITSGSLLYLPRSVQEIDLGQCPALDATAAGLLRDGFPALHTVRLWGAAWLDDAALTKLLEVPALKHLTIGDCSSLTPVHVAAIRAATTLRHLDATRSPCFTDDEVALLREDRPDLTIVRKVW